MSISPALTIVPGDLETTGNIVTGVAFFVEQIFGESAASPIHIENTLNIRNAVNSAYTGNITFDGAIIIDGMASFESAIAIGKNTRAFAEYSIAIGSSDIPSEGAFAQYTSGIAIGRKAVSFGTEAIGLGVQSSANANHAISIGKLSSALAAGSMAVGNFTYVSAAAQDAVALGRAAQSTSSNGIALGLSSSVSGGGGFGVAIGSGAQAANTNAIAIGGSSTANKIGSIALGSSSVSTGSQSIACGQASTASGGQSVAFGNSSVSSAAGTVAVGNGATASATKTVAIGFDAQATTGTYGIAIGANSRSLSTDCVAIGRTAFAQGSNCIAIGRDTGGDAATGANNVAIGQLALTSMNNVSAAFNVGIGYRAGFGLQTGERNTLVGGNAGVSIVSGSNNVCIGSGTGVSATYTIRNVVIGSSGFAGNASVAIGWGAGAAVTNGVAIGRTAYARGSNSISIGFDSGGDNTTGADNIAIGRFALTSMNNVTATINTAVGYGAGRSILTGFRNSLLGFNAGDTLVSGSYNVCMGASSDVDTTNTVNGVAIGHTAVTANTSVGIGAYTSASGLRSVSIGFGSAARGITGISIGYNTGPDVSTGTENVAIGQKVMVHMTNNSSSKNIGLGNNVLRYFTSGANAENVAVGFEAMGGTPGGKTSNAQFNVCLGPRSGYVINGGDYNVCIGTNAGDTLTTGVQNVCVGINSDVTAASVFNGVAIGNTAMCFNRGIAIGQTALASGSQSIAIGKGTLANATNSMAMGYKAEARGTYSISIGRYTYNNASYAVAIGGGAAAGGGARVTTSSTSGIAMGRGASVSAFEGIAIGVLSNTNANLGISIGVQSSVTATQSIAIGRLSGVTATYGVAIGRSSSAQASKSIAIGYTAVNTVANTAVLAPSGTELLRTLDPAVGNFTFRTVGSTVSESPTGFFIPTAAQLVGGYISVTPSNTSGGAPVVAWTRQQIINTTGQENRAPSAVDSSGNLYLALNVSGTLSGGTFLGSTDLAVCKYDPNGNLLWVKQNSIFNTTAFEFQTSIDVTPDGYIYVAYSTDGTISGGTQTGSQSTAVLKLDTNGNYIWSRQQSVFNPAPSASGPRIAVDFLGNAYITFYTGGTVSGGTTAGSNDIVVFKLDTNGTHVWNQQQTVFNTSASDFLSEIDVDASGNVYILYYTTGTVSGGSNTGSGDLVVFKLNSSGALQWSQQSSLFNTTADDTSFGTEARKSIAVDKLTGDVYVAYSTTGTVSGGTNIGTQDIVVFKLNTNGAHQWSQQSALFNSTLADTAVSIGVDKSGNVYIAYASSGTVSGGTQLGSPDIVVFKLNSSGTHQWIIQSPIYNTTSSDDEPKISVTPTGDVYVTYVTTGTVSGGTFLGVSDIVVFKLNALQGIGVLAIGSSGGITGTNLSAYSQITANAYIGLTFRCLVKVTGSNLLAISGTSGVAANGITPIGTTTPLNTPRELIFINTGTNTWDMLIQVRQF